jgi:hypothetical protein
MISDLAAILQTLALNTNQKCINPRPGNNKDGEIGICCCSAKHAALRRKRKHWLARNQDDWSDMSIHGLLFQLTNTRKIQIIILVQYKADLILISLKIIMI